jgi:O-antigen ligase
MNISPSIFKYFFGYGVLIFPLFLLLGPLISEVYLILLVLFAFYYIHKENKFYFYKNKFVIFFFIFYISTLISTLINFYNYDYVKSGILYFRIPLFSIAIWYALTKYDLFSKNIIIFYIIFLSIIIIDSLIQYYFGKNILGYNVISGRISSFFGDELILGGFLQRTLPFFLIYIILNDRFFYKKLNIIYCLIISLICVTIYLSGERTSFFLLILFFTTIFFSNSYLRRFIIIITIFSIFFSFIISQTRLSDDVNPSVRMFSKTIYQLTVGGEEQYEKSEKSEKKLFNKFYIFSRDHHGHYLLSYKIFKDFPILGTGPKGFRYLCRNKIYIVENYDGCSTHPHNTYAQILTSNGIIGFLLLIIVFFYLSIEIFRCKKKINNEKQFDKYMVAENVILSAVFVNFWPLIPTGNFFNNWLSMSYFYPIGFYLYFKFRNEKKFS